ncbi:GtrA family protein [Methylobacterium longum]|uniref:GtrA family protein n=1 Tax=Methylobacterium longum TaxID=767694 RepID=UPI00338D6844
MLQFAIFATVGIINTGLDFVVFQVLFYNDVGSGLASAAGYLTGAISSFFMNKIFTFSMTITQLSTAVSIILRFAVLQCALASISALIVTMLVKYFNVNNAKLLSIIPLVFLNFLSSKYFVYEQKSV